MGTWAQTGPRCVLHAVMGVPATMVVGLGPPSPLRGAVETRGHEPGSGALLSMARTICSQAPVGLRPP